VGIKLEVSKFDLRSSFRWSHMHLH